MSTSDTPPDSDPNTENTATHPCSRCKKLTSAVYKTCEPCRVKKRAEKKRLAERKKEREMKNVKDGIQVLTTRETLGIAHVRSLDSSAEPDTIPSNPPPTISSTAQVEELTKKKREEKEIVGAHEEGTVDTHACSRCKETTSTRYKMCEACRKKNAEVSRNYMLKRRERDRLEGEKAKANTANGDGKDADRIVPPDENTALGKRKAELDSDRNAKKAKTKSKRANPLTIQGEPIPEYQFQSDLLSTLSSLHKSSLTSYTKHIQTSPPKFTFKPYPHPSPTASFFNPTTDGAIFADGTFCISMSEGSKYQYPATMEEKKWQVRVSEEYVQWIRVVNSQAVAREAMGLPPLGDPQSPIEKFIPVEFVGSFSIVRDPKVDEERKAVMVSKELQGVGLLHTDHPNFPSCQNSTPTSHTRAFTCRCLELLANVPTPTYTPTTHKPTKDSHLVDLQNKKCGGTITIHAEVDTSHPRSTAHAGSASGVIGQRIVVRVTHPDAKD